MRTLFIGHFRPTNEEFSELWKNCIFAVDANVLLNLYRYSDATRKELEKALETVKDRLFIPYQAAKEFLKNRLSVTAGQANEYPKATKSINDLLNMLSTKDRHPFLPDSELPKLKEYCEQLVELLNNQKNILLSKLTNDEILDFIGNTFNGKTGKPFDAEKMNQIEKDGADRYQREIPPGYKDFKKDSTDDSYRKYGDLIVWYQIIEYAKSQNKPLIFITDDKKEDWWLEQSGKTIGPRPEIISEFNLETEQRFWMYTVEKFIKESAKTSDTTVSDEIINEIIKVSLDAKEKSLEDSPSIEVSQEKITTSDDLQEGLLIVTLKRPMRYATGTGKFHPRFSSIPDFDVIFLDSPYTDTSAVGLSYGCGTTINFNVHLRDRHGKPLEAGDYIFKYIARVKRSTDEFSQTTSNELKDCQQSGQPACENVGGADAEGPSGSAG